jgi:hypothetical protein
MKYSIISFGGSVLPVTWDAESTTESGVLEEARKMYDSSMTIVPSLLISWDEGRAKRIVLGGPEGDGMILDNAGELFGIATTAEYFEEIVQAMEAEENC